VQIWRLFVMYFIRINLRIKYITNTEVYLLVIYIFKLTFCSQNSMYYCTVHVVNFPEVESAQTVNIYCQCIVRIVCNSSPSTCLLHRNPRAKTNRYVPRAFKKNFCILLPFPLSWQATPWLSGVKPAVSTRALFLTRSVLGMSVGLISPSVILTCVPHAL